MYPPLRSIPHLPLFNILWAWHGVLKFFLSPCDRPLDSSLNRYHTGFMSSVRWIENVGLALRVIQF